MDDLSQLFPYDAYNFLNNFIYKDDNYVIFLFELIFFENVFAILCMKISILEYNPNQAFICLEINFNNFLNEINFHNPDSFDFGIIYYDGFNLIPLTYGRKDIFEDIKEVFNDTVSEIYILDEKKRITFELFQYRPYSIN
jgi:hypothetical protein